MMQTMHSSSEPRADSTNENVMLTVDIVSKEFQLDRGTKITALSEMSFNVAKNESCVLLGPSGCGKSTMLRLVAGLEEPTMGRIFLHGSEIVGPGPDRGMIFQTYTSFPWLTVQENVEYGLMLRGMGKAERAEHAAHFIELVNLTRFKDAYPKALSGGMKQRVAIARTLANDPAILLMDEPFGALDAETRWRMQELLLRVIEKSHTTVLLVTHDIHEAIFLADRIIFMTRRPGRVREVISIDFKQTVKFRNKEEMVTNEEYGRLEQKIMRMMREEALDNTDD